MAQDPYKYFRIEARELMEQLNQAALDLDKGLSPAEQVPRLLRLAHTLKGAARVVRQTGIAEQTHTIEEALSPFREAGDSMPREAINQVLKLLDGIAAQLAMIDRPADAAGNPSRKAVTEETARTLRADVVEMDALLEGLAEAHAQCGALRRILANVGQVETYVDRLVEQSASFERDDTAARGETRAGSAVGGQLRSTAHELHRSINGVERRFTESLDHLDRELQVARDLAERLRLIAGSTLFTALERTARDAAQTLGRQVLFEGFGGEIRLDAHVLDAIQAALHHCVRNSVVHGIESEKSRLSAGKPAQGRIRVDITRRGRSIVFSCQDDGRGVDLDAVRRALQLKGLQSAESQSADAGILLGLLLRGGISTSGTVTEIAGRGIGLDVVRETAEKLGGEARVQTTAGIGTTLEIIVPLSVAVIEVLMVESAGVKACVPLDAVQFTLRAQPSDIIRSASGEMLIRDGRMIPFAALSRFLEADAASSHRVRTCSAVLLKGIAGEAAMGVDRLVGTSSIVLRPLPELVPLMAIVAGVWLDPEGNPQIVIDPEGWIGQAQRIGLPQELPLTAHAPILIVDDSLTTRMLEQSILESAGFEVELAASGEEALEAARRKRYALFLVDVEMPGIDGFTFIERTRLEPALRDVPAILVTSRSSADDRRRGEQVGASDYIVKGDFDQARLLNRIRQLMAASP